MIGYLLAIAFILGLVGMNWWYGVRQAANERDLAEAQAKVDELVVQTQAQAAQSMANETAAYVAGEANAKTITKVIYQQGQAYAATNAVLANPQCYIPADGLQLLASARAGTQPTALAAGTHGPMSGAGTDNSGQAGRGVVPVGGVPADAAGRGDVSRVPTPPSNAGSNGQVSGTTTGRLRPKPQPIQ